MFDLDKKELKKFHKWDAEHEKTCEILNSSTNAAIGGRITYCFTPTSLGTVIKVTCACGESHDCTEYNW